MFVKGNTWYGRWRVGGKQPKRSLGPVKSAQQPGGLTKTQAEAKLREKMAQHKPPPSGELLTFKTVADRHIARLEDLRRKRSTIQDYRQRLRVHLEPAFGPMPIDQIGREDVERFQTNKLRGGQSPKTVRNHMALLHAVFKYAEKQGLIGSNPAKLVDRPMIHQSDEVKYLTLAEVNALITAVPDDALGEVERVMYLAATRTGLRQSELLGLQWRYVDFSAKKIRVRQTYVRKQFDTPKSKRGSRVVPLPPQVARNLKEHRRRSPWSGAGDLVFAHPETGRPIDRSTVYHRYRKARDRARIAKVPFHGLRHTFGTTMAMAGTPMRKIQEWMGHRDYSTTLIYAHYQPGDQEAELVERAFGGAQEGHKVESATLNSEQVKATRLGSE